MHEIANCQSIRHSIVCRTGDGGVCVCVCAAGAVWLCIGVVILHPRHSSLLPHLFLSEKKEKNCCLRQNYAMPSFIKPITTTTGTANATKSA